MFVLKSKYEAMENRALKAEATIREYERVAMDRATTELAEYEAKRTPKPQTTKINVTDGSEGIAVSNGLGDAFTRNEAGKLPMSKVAIATRTNYIKSSTKNGSSVADIASETGLTASSVRSALKK